MKNKAISLIIYIFVFVTLWYPASAMAQNAAPETGKVKPKSLSVEEVINKLDKRFSNADFSANFSQESTLKAMDIVDTAKGKVWFKHPGMMRWEYKSPEKYAIITDGKTLWIYRPEDNQVVVGNAMTYFSNGKGASFLANFKLVKDAFSVTFTTPVDESHYTLKLIPHQKQLDLSEILLNIDKKSFNIDSVTSINAYGDDTQITFSGLKFESGMDASLFHFKPPPGADVVQLETGN